jgi:hypothetical protein
MRPIVQAIGGSVLYVGAVTGVAYGVPVALGVWWGKRRSAALVERSDGAPA